MIAFLWTLWTWQGLKVWLFRVVNFISLLELSLNFINLLYFFITSLWEEANSTIEIFVHKPEHHSQCAYLTSRWHRHATFISGFPPLHWSDRLSDPHPVWPGAWLALMFLIIKTSHKKRLWNPKQTTIFGQGNFHQDCSSGLLAQSSRAGRTCLEDHTNVPVVISHGETTMELWMRIV